MMTLLPLESTTFQTTFQFDLIAILLSASAVIAALGVIWTKLVGPAFRLLKEIGHDTKIARLTIEGQKEIRDPVSGRVLQESVPSLGARMHAAEEKGRENRELIDQLSASVAELSKSVSELARSVTEHNTWSERSHAQIRATIKIEDSREDQQ